MSECADFATENEKTKRQRGPSGNFVFSGSENEIVSRRIREVIGDRYVTNFAKQCGIAEAVIRTYINDGRMPPLSKAAAIAEAGGVTLDWLATGREPKYRKDVVAAMQRPEAPEPLPDKASADLAELVAIYKEAAPEGRHALLVLARAIRDRTMRAWLAAGQAVAEAASLFDKSK